MGVLRHRLRSLGSDVGQERRPQRAPGASRRPDAGPRPAAEGERAAVLRRKGCTVRQERRPDRLNPHLVCGHTSSPGGISVSSSQVLKEPQCILGDTERNSKALVHNDLNMS